MEEFEPIIELMKTVVDTAKIELETNNKDMDLSTDEYQDIENTILDLMMDYIKNESAQYANPDFHENMIKDITELLYEEYKEYGVLENDQEEIEIIVKNTSLLFFEMNDIPTRSRFYELPQNTDEKWEYHEKIVEPLIKTDSKKVEIETQIQYLKNKPQPAQRSKEWYEYRYNLITASNIWKIFSSDAQQNSLIYEKCRPFEQQHQGYASHNTESSLHWGIKYEPLSVLVYEKENSTKVGDFGCIQHETYPFLGASPDGINIDQNSNKYGMMIEVKNIVNREITGIPSEAYWIQMQLQMETCDLPECDFIETRFKEYEDEQPFYEDESRKYKGVILHFMKKTQNDFHYEYMPLDLSTEKIDIDKWISQKRDALRSDYSLFKTHYWYLDQYSCVLVERNRFWFESVIPKIEDFWKLIEKERVEGFEHRAPKKRANSFGTDFAKGNFCLVKLDP